MLRLAVNSGTSFTGPTSVNSNPWNLKCALNIWLHKLFSRPDFKIPMISIKRWFVSYRLRPEQRRGKIYARTSETFKSEGEAKSFARTLDPDSDINVGTLNPQVPKQFYGQDQMAGWLDDGQQD